MRILTSVLLPIAAASLLVACSGNAGAPNLPSVGAGSQGVAGPATSAHLYVANQLGSTVREYVPNTGALSGTIHGGVSSPDWITFDSAGKLYVSNATGNGGAGDVTIYPSGQTTPSLTLKKGISNPTAVAVGPQDDVYVANAGNNTVTMYDQGSNQLVQTLGSTQGVQNPQAMIINQQNGDLYVANGPTTMNPGSVTMYTGKAGSRALALTITSGINNPRALAIDYFFLEPGALYVANDGSPGSVTEYSATYASGAPTLTIANVPSPDALAVTTNVIPPQIHLFVATGSGNQVEVYQPPSVSAVETISGLSNPTSLAFGPSGFLNVANDTTPGSVVQFCGSITPSCTSPSRTISAHMDGPISIAFGP